MSSLIGQAWASLLSLPSVASCEHLVPFTLFNFSTYKLIHSCVPLTLTGGLRAEWRGGKAQMAAEVSRLRSMEGTEQNIRQPNRAMA